MLSSLNPKAGNAASHLVSWEASIAASIAFVARLVNQFVVIPRALTAVVMLCKADTLSR
jgi:hypothetical protein